VVLRRIRDVFMWCYVAWRGVLLRGVPGNVAQRDMVVCLCGAVWCVVV